MFFVICQFSFVLSFPARIYEHLMNVISSDIFTCFSRGAPTIWSSLPHDIHVVDILIIFTHSHFTNPPRECCLCSCQVRDATSFNSFVYEWCNMKLDSIGLTKDVWLHIK